MRCESALLSLTTTATFSGDCPWTTGATVRQMVRQVTAPTSGLSRSNEDQIPERGARMASRDDREYREYLREEQRRQPGCPARKLALDRPRQATRARRIPMAFASGTFALRNTRNLILFTWCP